MMRYVGFFELVKEIMVVKYFIKCGRFWGVFKVDRSCRKGVRVRY